MTAFFFNYRKRMDFRRLVVSFFKRKQGFTLCFLHFQVHLSSDLALMPGIIPSFLSLQTEQRGAPFPEESAAV